MADTISSAGLLFLHLQGRRAGAAVEVETMDTYRCIGEGFYRPAGPHGAAGAHEAEIHVFLPCLVPKTGPDRSTSGFAAA